MSSVKHLREFISERLTAAAEEIFTEFEKTIVQYEEEIDRQRRLLDITWKPQINLHTADLPQQHDGKQKEVLADQQLFKQEMDISLDQEEVHISQEEEQLVVKDETDPVVQCKSESEEKFIGVENTSIQYEEEADHRPRVLNTIMKPPIRSQRTASQGCTQETTPTSPVQEIITNPFPELSRHNSDDAIIQDEDYSPPSKQQAIDWTDIPAKNLVEFALSRKPAGDQIIKEYLRTKGLTDSSRRKLVNIVTADMTEIHGTAPPRQVREMYAQGIIEMFPSLRDPYSKNGYEHFYDGESGSGYLAWRLKTIQRKSTSSEGRGSSCPLTGGGPTARSCVKYSSEEATIHHRMKMKYMKMREPNLEEFLNSAFMKSSIIPSVREGIRVYDETGTEVDADIFEDVVQQPNAGVLTFTFDNASQGCTQETTPTSPVQEIITNPFPELSRHNSDDAIIQEEDYRPPSKQQAINWMEIPAKNLVEFALTRKPAGDQIIKEYARTKGLTDSSRRKLVNILTADMTEVHGTAPPRRVREIYAKGIIEMFPNLRDPYSKNGYEHFYDGESGSGYLAWRLKTIQRKSTSSEGRGSSCPLTGGGPTVRRNASFRPEVIPSEEQCKEAILFMKYSSDEATIKHKMKMTFDYRRKMVLDKDNSSDVWTEFPRFKDVKGLIEQDFILEFGEDIASKFLERWPTIFRQKIIQQSKTLLSSSDLEELIYCAERASSIEEFEETRASGWDRDLASIILLLHLIPPSCQGRKRPGKVSASQAEKHLVVFQKSGSGVQEQVDVITSSTHPYLLAVGPSRSSIHQFFIVLDQQVIPCKSTSSLGAFDELFKAHFVFGTVYNQMLHNMYTFIQTTVYNIDVGRVQETPRVAEIRARLLN